MQTDVKSASCGAGATTAAFVGRTRLRGLVISYPSGGTVTVNDNGVAVFSFTAPAAIGTTNVIIPGEGILCSTGVSVVCAASTTAVVFYG